MIEIRFSPVVTSCALSVVVSI